ncbi:hypothetical protein PENSPDRAFT_695458 [Peniophora sp. CONT]|nr:hypothetical protein PENSPDRAFT_695458 [Peniophora sp. CONT]
MNVDPSDEPIDFHDLDGLSQFVGGVQSIGGPVTAADTTIVLYHLALDGTELPLPRQCCDGNVIAYTPDDNFNYADEDRWFGLVVGANEHGGAIQVRPLLSGRRLYAVAEQEPEGLNNADDFLYWLDEAEVRDEDQILSMTGVHALPYQCITHVLSIDEFTTINFQGALGVDLGADGWVTLHPLSLLF